MKASLSLRQHKIIHTLRGSKAFMTSEEISKVLNVSSKTIRTDINDVNNMLESEGIYIASVKGKGFILQVKNEELLKNLTKDQKVFLNQDDRVYYIATRLCTAEHSINFFDLEDEIAVSSSTLSGDLTAFKKRFVHDVPFVKLNISKNELFLENDERKRRFILEKLLCDHWDYNSTGNIYYESEFIDSEVFSAINSISGRILYQHGIILDDYSLISLNLYLSISYYRIREGHQLNVPVPDDRLPCEIMPACREMFGAIEEHLDFTFPENEIEETAYIIAETRLHRREDFKARVFPEEYRKMAASYLDRIYDVYGFDLHNDDEFNDRLVSFVAQLFRPMKDLTVRDIPDHLKNHLFVEYDVAELFPLICEDKCNITENDLLYLAWAISGAFFSFYANNSEKRFETVILCHMSVHSMWSLKLALKNQFGGYLNIKEVIPVYLKDYYDFSGVDLVLSTVDKKIQGIQSEILHISPYMTREDSFEVLSQIRKMKIQDIYPEQLITINALLDTAFVHENMEFSSQYSLIEFMCQEFISNNIFEQHHMFSILKRESISSFASNPAILLLYSTTPGTNTQLSVLTLKHRIIWNKYKIRIVFMISLAKEDTRELFYLQNTLFHRCFQPDILKSMKTIAEIKEYFQGNE